MTSTPSYGPASQQQQTHSTPLTEAQKQQLMAMAKDPTQVLAAVNAYNRRMQSRRFEHFFPDETHEWQGEVFHARSDYRAHMLFTEATAYFREVAMMASNRSGKTTIGAYDVVVWAAGKYPPWWKGVRFNRAVSIWVCGKTNETVRDILQRKLLGDISTIEYAKEGTTKRTPTRRPDGTGMVPGEMIGDVEWRVGLADTIDYVRIKHASGKWSIISFKSYQQGRGAFEGTEKDIIWLDEEPPLDIATECLTRTATTGGRVLYTFTPLEGLSEVAMRFVPGQDSSSTPPALLQMEPSDIGIELTSSRYVVTCGWDDVPHLSAKTKEDLLSSYPLHERLARTKGIPGLGSGAIYPIEADSFTVDPFRIPRFWPRAYGMDVGWNRTAVAWGAIDSDTDVLYIYTEHYEGQQPPAVHAAAIKARGDWIPGVIDPASRGRSQIDGQQLIVNYQELGLMISPANNTVESGIFAVYERLTTGRLKVFSTCTNLLREYKFYRRDDKGRIVKKEDHLMDALRYLVISGVARAAHQVAATEQQKLTQGDPRAGY